MKEASKWRVNYAAYHETVKNGTATLVVDNEEDGPGQNALPSRPRSHKATKADLSREASTLELRQALEKIMAESQVTLAKMDDKRRLEKEASAATLPQPHQRGY
jgi:hypothetical protein